jgi:hypothetical protein
MMSRDESFRTAFPVLDSFHGPLIAVSCGLLGFLALVGGPAPGGAAAPVLPCRAGAAIAPLALRRWRRADIRRGAEDQNSV